MSSTSSYLDSWQKLYDPSYMSLHSLNDNFQGNPWPVQKRLKQSLDNYIPVENFICGNQPSDESSFFPIPTLETNFGLTKCSKCGTEEGVQQHGYCGTCYEQINSIAEPLITKYKIRCNGCQGWSLFLVQEDGFCKHCRYSIDNGIKIKTFSPSVGESAKPLQEPEFVRCRVCNGWGKHLVKENGQCQHCTYQQEKLLFEAKWKTRCEVCKAWGLDLVKEDGLCNHCRRQQADERVFFSKVLNQNTGKGSENQNINMYINWNTMDSSVLGKRTGNKEDEFYL